MLRKCEGFPGKYEETLITGRTGYVRNRNMSIKKINESNLCSENIDQGSYMIKSENTGNL